MITKEEAAGLLPKVGEKLRKAPTIIFLRGYRQVIPLQDCEVVEVNRAHLWYRVRFKNGFTECYKVPEIPANQKGGAKA